MLLILISYVSCLFFWNRHSHALPHRAGPCSPATSSPRGPTSSTTRGATTATTTWRGASCHRTSRPGERKIPPSRKRDHGLHVTPLIKTPFAQSGRRQLRVGEPEQRHQCLHGRGRRLHPPSASGGARPLLTRVRTRSLAPSLLLTCGISFSPTILPPYLCLHCLS